MISSVSADTASTVIVPSNTDRKGIILWNNSTSTAYIKFGLIASTTSFTWKLTAQTGYEFPTPIYIGEVTAVWDAAIGTMLVTEMI
jgi:hypothetical protein